MTQVMTGAPIWVWPLLAALVFAGLRARQNRRVHVGVLYALPALGILALRSTAALPADVAIWSAFVLAYGVGAWAGFVVQGRWLLGREGHIVELAGESLTLVMIMIVFWANFVGGMVQAIAPHVYANGAFQFLFIGLIALSSGSFSGRAVRAWQG